MKNSNRLNLTRSCCSVKSVVQLLLSNFFLFACLEQTGLAQCVSLGKGEMFMKVDKCQQISKPEDLYLTKPREKQLKNMSPSLREKFVKSYQGIWVYGNIIRSKATGGELNPTKTYLFGKNISAMAPNAPQSCAEVQGKTIHVDMKEACCQGGIDMPCFLATSYVFTKIIDVFDEVKEPERRQEVKTDTKVFSSAAEKFAKKKYGETVKILKKEETAKNSLDVKSYHLLAKAYRRLDLCPKAILVIRDKIYNKFLKKDYWGTDEQEVHDATFLLAKCYAKSSDGVKSMDVMRGMMVDPEKFKTYLQKSLRDPDFGWIHTQAVYKKYKQDLSELSPPIR